VDVVRFSILRGQRSRDTNLRGEGDPWSVPFGLVLKDYFVSRVGCLGLLQCDAGTGNAAVEKWFTGTNNEGVDEAPTSGEYRVICSGWVSTMVVVVG